MSYKNFIFTAILVLVSIGITLVLGEGFLRLKNSTMRNYDIEMWKYSKVLKRKSDNPILGHEHIPSKSAILQSVEIRINKHGLRGRNIGHKQLGKKRILFLGSSITLGWGVPEEETMPERIDQMFKNDGKPAEILNAGIGNYNSTRYVERFLGHLTHLDPDVLVVQYFVNDAEVLSFSRGNWALRLSQLAVTLWTAYNRFLQPTGEKTLIGHYESAYDSNAKGFKDMTAALKRLANYAKEKEIRVLLSMIPDFHNLKDYPFHFIHHKIARVSKDLGFVYVDLLPAVVGRDEETLFGMPGDPHPNSLGHELMANELYPHLKPLGVSSN